MNKLIFSLFLFSSYLLIGQESQLVGNLSVNQKLYEFRIKKDDTKKSFLFILKEAQEFKSVELTYNYNESVFLQALKDVSSKIVGTATFSDEDKKKMNEDGLELYRMVIKDLNKTDVILSMYDSQKIEYSGQLRLNPKVMLIEQQSNSAFKKAEKEAKAQNKTVERKSPGKLEFKPLYGSIRLYNNRINTLSVTGTIDDKEYTIRNNKFSIPFRFLNNNSETSVIKVYIDDKIYLLKVDELLDYTSLDSEFNFAVKNKNYSLLPSQYVKIESRNLFDYFTGIVFSDFLGMSSPESNNLLMAEGRVIIPLALVNKSQFNMIRYFEGYLNTSLYNGQGTTGNYVNWNNYPDNTAVTPISPGKTETLQLFDFFSKRNIEAGLNLGFYSIEWKGISTFITFDYGIQMYRTRLRHIKDDKNNFDDYNMFAIGQGPKVKFEIRPQVNFGADINIGVMGYKFNGLNTSSPIQGTLKKQLIAQNTFYNMFYISSNFYTKLNDKETNGGLYFRLEAYYDFASSRVAPQLLAGYATNLTTFINKFKKKDEVKP